MLPQRARKATSPALLLCHCPGTVWERVAERKPRSVTCHGEQANKVNACRCRIKPCIKLCTGKYRKDTTKSWDSYNSPNASVHLNPNKLAGSGSCFPWMLDTLQAVLKVTKKKQIRIV